MTIDLDNIRKYLCYDKCSDDNDNLWTGHGMECSGQFADQFRHLYKQEISGSLATKSPQCLKFSLIDQSTTHL